MSINYWHQGRMLFALARYFDWSSQRMMSQFAIDGGIADLVFVSRAGYATEVEIKISLADWECRSLQSEVGAGSPAHRAIFLRHSRDAGRSNSGLGCRRLPDSWSSVVPGPRVVISIRSPSSARRIDGRQRNSRSVSRTSCFVPRITVSGGRKCGSGRSDCSIGQSGSG